MKQRILKILRSKAFQPIWGKLHHISLIGMNHWGGALLSHSGEIYALNYMIKRLKHKNSIMVFDGGANHGQYALLVNSLIKNGLTIHSFEPSKYAYSILIKNTQTHHNIITHNFGLGNNKAMMKLYSEEIELTTLDSFCNEHTISIIDILKMDIEGHELAALMGASEKLKDSKINFIQFEFSECNIDSKTYFKDFYNLLSSDFKMYRIVSDGLYRLNHYDESLEIFHTANFLAERKTLR